MKLGGNTRDVDSFVDQLESEGVKVVATNVPAKTGGGLSKVGPSLSNRERKRAKNRHFFT